ncbi:hypothetical protein [Streptomyces sp. NPDC086519]|uniref:hypothetical protein n=1 Tax=Streptomyces sp. NPDC086519 TaxID=3154863 RepID=UPI003442DA31
MTDTHSLTVQQADALWDAIAIPGPQQPTFTDQHERVCRTVTELLDEAMAGPRLVFDEIRTLHAPAPDWSWAAFGCTHTDKHSQLCARCRTCYPCPTLAALDEPAHEPAADGPPLYDKIASMFSEPLPPPGDEPPATVLPCSSARFRDRHDPHRWEPQPGMRPVQCPGYAHVPAATEEQP